jgi:hypothetical protein
MQIVMRLPRPATVTDDRRVLTRRTPSRQQFQRDYPGSVLLSASGSAIKRITAGVKAGR